MANIERVTLVGIMGLEGMDPVVLKRGSWVVGRSDGNDIVLKKNDISRQHARIEVRETELVVNDLGSANGTKVNGQRIAGPVVLNEGDEVQFGDRKFRCQIEVRQETAPVELPPTPLLESTAIWKPPPSIAAIADRPAEATAAWVPSKGTGQKPGSPAPPALGKKKPVAASPPPPRPAAPAPAPERKDAPQGRGMLVILLLLVMVAALVVVGLVAYTQLTQKAGGTTAGYTPILERVPDEGPVQLRVVELAKLSRPDRMLYNRAAYFFEIKNFVGARDTVRQLSTKYPGNKAVERKQLQIDTAIKNEISRQMQYAVESVRYLKHEEALEAYRLVARLAIIGSQERTEAEKQIKVLVAQLAAPRLE